MACSICSRPDVDAINAALLRGSSRSVGERFGLNRMTLQRHKAHIPKVAQVVPPVRLVHSQKVAQVRTVGGTDARLLRGQMLPAVVEKIGIIEAKIAAAEKDLDDPDLGLREKHLVLRTSVMLHEAVRKYLELATKCGALDTPDADRPEASTVDDVRREVAALQAELEAADG